MKKIVLITLIFTFIISAVLGISIILFDLWNDATAKVLLSTIIIFGFSIPGLICSANYEKVKNKTFPIIGIAICFISCIYLLLLAWEFLRLNNLALKFIASGALLSSSVGHISLLLLVNSKVKIVNCFKYGTVILSAIMDIISLLSIFLEIDVTWKLSATIAILIALGTLVTPLLKKLNNSKSDVINTENC